MLDLTGHRTIERVWVNSADFIGSRHANVGSYGDLMVGANALAVSTQVPPEGRPERHRPRDFAARLGVFRRRPRAGGQARTGLR